MTVKYHFYSSNREKIIQDLGQVRLKEELMKMLLIRNFEIRGEAAYQQGKVGGFYHSYMGQEAIQVGCVAASGTNHWFTTTYRCHALAMLLGATPNEMMAELYGRTTGNAKGHWGVDAYVCRTYAWRDGHCGRSCASCYRGCF